MFTPLLQTFLAGLAVVTRRARRPAPRPLAGEEAGNRIRLGLLLHLSQRLGVDAHEVDRVADEVLLDGEVQRGIGGERGRVVHLDEPGLEVPVHHHVDA